MVVVAIIDFFFFFFRLRLFSRHFLVRHFSLERGHFFLPPLFRHRQRLLWLFLPRQRRRIFFRMKFLSGEAGGDVGLVVVVVVASAVVVDVVAVEVSVAVGSLLCL